MNPGARASSSLLRATSLQRALRLEQGQEGRRLRQWRRQRRVPPARACRWRVVRLALTAAAVPRGGATQ
jgi:hypothetical protein